MQPDYLTEGTTPRRTDGRVRVWAKILGGLQNAAGADPANNPRRMDSRRQLKGKVNKARTA